MKNIERIIKEAIVNARMLGLTVKEINLSEDDYKELGSSINNYILAVDAKESASRVNISTYNGVEVVCALPDNPDNKILADSYIVGVPPSEPFRIVKERIFSLRTGEELIN